MPLPLPAPSAPRPILNRPGFPGGNWVASLRGEEHGLKGCVVGAASASARDAADGLEEATGVEPIHPVQSGEFDSFDAVPGLAMDYLGLEQAVDCLGQGVVIRISNTTHGGFGANLGQAFGVADADVLGWLN